MECLLENSGQILGFLNNVAVLYKRLARARDIRLLKDVSAEQIASYLTCDGYHRNRVGVRGGNTRDQVCSARSRGRNANARFAAAARVSACRVSRVLLLTNKNVLNIGVIYFVIERANCRARITKDDLDALSFQTFYHDFRSANHVHCPSLAVILDKTPNK